MEDPGEVLEVSEACDAAAAVIADVICRNQPTLPFWQVLDVASRELFDAARMVGDVAVHEASDGVSRIRLWLEEAE